MAMPKNNVVRTRLTDLEKQDWSRAAGGAGKLSEWMRRVCNEAAERDRLAERERNPLVTVTPMPAPGMTDLMISPEAIDAALAPNAKPKIVGDAIEREVLSDGLAGTERQPEPVAQEDQAHRGARPLPATDERRDASSAGSRTASGGDGESCPRWMHHRDGVYCGACKRVIGK